MNPFFDKRYGIKSKNIGPFLAFGEEWFKKYQDWLLLLLNAPIIRLWFRWILRIHRDTKYRDIIIQIQPNNYKVLLPDGQIRGDFRTHPKFSKRVYFAFQWWWWGLHYMDELFKIAVPKVSFGFDTLTAYPDADPETNTVDGTVQRTLQDESFASIISSSGTSHSDASSPNYILYLICSTTENQFSGNYRTIFTFSTDIGSSASISNAVLSVAATTPMGNGITEETTIHIVSASPASNNDLVSADYSTLGSTSFANISTASFASWRNFTLDSNGINNIDKTGISKFGAISGWDLNASFDGSWGSGISKRRSIRSADNTGTSNDPKLVITYTLAEASNIKSIGGVAIASVKTASGVAKASIKKIVGLA